MTEKKYKFEGHNRFDYPDGLIRVTAGNGGESILVMGSGKSFLVDCGMAYCGEETVKNIEKALKDNGRIQLDGILMSHSHYDHIGALPYIKRRWPGAVVYGAQKAKDVFSRPNAKALMRELGTKARDLYSDSSEEILTEGLTVDEVVREGDEISIGNKYFKVLETKGHTDCSLTYVLEPDGIMFTSESTGVLESPDFVHTSILKSFNEAMESARKCREYGAKRVISPHYGIVPEGFEDRYFELYISCAEEKKNFIADLYRKGFSEEEITERFCGRYWSEEKEKDQPKEAFVINAGHMIKVVIDEFLK
ncbi:MAG: MBL fold metallo-hydrolase [Anaerovoracaceae bacterium]